MGGGGGGVILGEVKARPKDIISFSLDYISKSKVQTSNPSSSPIPLDTPARPAEFVFGKIVSACHPGFCLLTQEPPHQTDLDRAVEVDSGASGTEATHLLTRGFLQNACAPVLQDEARCYCSATFDIKGL